MSLKSRIEAVLFLTDKPLRAQAIARIVNHDVQLVRQAILELIHEYESREGGLEIADDDGYIVQVKDEYSAIIDEFVPMELPVSLLRTLSAIAIKQPVPQSQIIKIRGVGAYDHIKELIERELIIKREEGGRSPLLGTTKKFQEYFRLSHDAKSLRDELQVQAKEAEQEAAQAAAAAGFTADPLAAEEQGQTIDEDLASAGDAPTAADPPSAVPDPGRDSQFEPTGHLPEAAVNSDEIRA
jgi:segregation and condensation protein B